ncbi:hypothetical protein CRG98_021601 [Punica granatum]|uniref:Uncharacterized protein n=1 Tax=Punica granatum TaxID=22663 RepID=A0A2I0JP55_PUNGR|nr:hypothetical protein CRG98_021601 [Punica granatum]
MPPRAISRRVARVGVYQWLSLVAAIWLQSISGTNFNFPAYSSHLKQAMSICQVDLNNLAFASDAGKLLGWLSGVAALHLPIWLVLLIGASLGLISYGLQYLFLANHIPTAELSYPLLFFLTMLAGNSIRWMNTVCYAVIIGSFPSGSRQVAVGLTTAYQGLSANIYTNIVNVVAPAPTFAVSPHTPHPTAGRRANTYLLLSSVLPAIVSAVTAPFVSEKDDIASHGSEDGDDPNYHHHHNDSHCRDYDEAGVRELFGVLYVITIATGLYAVISSMGAIATKISPVYNAIGIGLFLIAPLMIPLIKRIRGSWLGRWWTNRQHESTRITDVAMSGSEAEDSHHLGGGESVLVIIKGGGSQEQRPPQDADGFVRGAQDKAVRISGHGDRQGNIGTVREDVGVKLMLRRLDFWLYFFMYLCGATLGLVYLNNLGQITESRGTSRTSTLVSLSSAFSFFGRLLPSLLDYFSSTAVISACTGAITSIAVSITTELFGTKNFSVNHNILVANIPIGSFIFGYFAAVLYRREGNGDGECIGMECYRNSFIIWGCLCFLGTNLALLLYARSRSFYSQGSTRR